MSGRWWVCTRSPATSLLSGLTPTSLRFRHTSTFTATELTRKQTTGELLGLLDVNGCLMTGGVPTRLPKYLCLRVFGTCSLRSVLDLFPTRGLHVRGA